jgi:hypothetical protein
MHSRLVGGNLKSFDRVEEVEADAELEVWRGTLKRITERMFQSEIAGVESKFDNIQIFASR